MNRRLFLGSTLSAAVAAAVPGTAYANALLHSMTVVSSSILGRSGDGVEVTIEKAALKELKDALRGQLLLAGNDGYDAARRVLNPSIEKFTDGFYTNTGDFETQSNLNRNYRGNYNRLVELKDQYDPSNLFRLNANVRPSTDS